MWEPGPTWTRVPAGAGGTTVGVWLGDWHGRPAVLKRVRHPQTDDPAFVDAPTHGAYWRREVDVAGFEPLRRSAGLRTLAPLAVEMDSEGVTLVVPQVDQVGLNGVFLARALGRFASTRLGLPEWAATHVLRDRLQMAERRGGWPTLARTTLADAMSVVWDSRTRHLTAYEALPVVWSHQDPTPGNLRGRDGDDVLALDWATFGGAPVGSDLGYLALSVREDFEVLLDAYLAGIDGQVAPAEVRLGATVMACFTAISRAEWALVRAAAGPGALAGKFNHPAVAPYLRSLQRLYPQLEALLG